MSRIQGILRALRSDGPSACRPGGWICVQLALLLLPSSALLAGVLLLIAITVQQPRQQPAPLTRPEARWLLLLSALMLVGSFWAVRGWVAWVGLFNWLPFFWFFLAIQPYLATPASRVRLGQWILAGTVPVIVVTLIQRATGWSGLLETFWGLIRWPMGDPVSAAGMFDNPNVTAAWLAITLPFLVATCLEPQRSRQRRGGAIGITAAASLALLINASRNALATLPVLWALSCGRRGRLVVLLACLGYGGLVLLKVHQGETSPLAPLLNLAVPDGLIHKLQEMGSGTNENLKYARRQGIYSAALGYIASSPWVGLGENGFGHVYTADLIRLNGTLPIGGAIVHSHNLLLEFSLSHGLPALVLLVAVIGRPLVQSMPLLWHRVQGMDRAWLLATLAMLWVHLWDLPSFDSRVNILDWLLVAAIAVIARSRSADDRKPEAAEAGAT
ncbi:MAG: O-antigen ligase family protein [Cyanobacteriota bacterium]